MRRVFAAEALTSSDNLFTIGKSAKIPVPEAKSKTQPNFSKSHDCPYGPSSHALVPVKVSECLMICRVQPLCGSIMIQRYLAGSSWCCASHQVTANGCLCAKDKARVVSNVRYTYCPGAIRHVCGSSNLRSSVRPRRSAFDTLVRARVSNATLR